jgi:hypothetical protein
VMREHRRGSPKQQASARNHADEFGSHRNCLLKKTQQKL